MEWLIAAAAGGLSILVLVAVAAVAAILLFAGLLLWLRWRRRRVDPLARREMLENAGYTSAGPGQWSLKIEDTALVFDDGEKGPAGWRWTVRLPRYNTMTLTVTERSEASAGQMERTFTSEIEELDARFVLTAALPARTLPLVANRSVASAMLALPYLSLRLAADELVIEDPKLEGLAKLTGSTAVGTKAALAAEAELHQRVLVLVHQVFRCLYTPFSGTIMPDFR